jgi:uncharacterized protein with HEPN domain
MRSDRLLLQDILDAVEVIRQYLPPDRAVFDANPPLQSHILRNVMIVGEASWRLSQQLKSHNAHIPWKQIAGMRHILVHDYFRVDWDVVFTTARDDVPAFKPQIEAILAALPPDPTVP